MKNGLQTGAAIALFLLLLAGCTANGGFDGQSANNEGGGGLVSDVDGDGVGDSDDLCPGTAEGADVNSIGCSEDQFGSPLPAAAKCDSYTSGTATADDANGNLCGLSPALDPAMDSLAGTESCYVADAPNAADGNPDSFASMNFTAALLDPNAAGFGVQDPISGNVTITVSDIGSRPAGSVAAFDVEVPAGTLDLGVLESIQVRTLQDGAVMEAFESAEGVSQDGSGLLFVDVLGMSGGSGRFAAGFIASQPYDAMAITASAALLGVDIGLDESESSLFVYDACSGAFIPTE